MVRLLVTVAALLMAACASAPRDPHAETCAVMAAYAAGGGPVYLNQEQCRIAYATRSQGLPSGGLACGDVTYRTDFAYDETIYSDVAFTADGRYAVVRYARWWTQGRGYTMVCMLERDRHTWRPLGCAPSAIT